jgi:hypothetical protein
MMVTQVGAEVWRSTSDATVGAGGGRQMLVQLL